MPLRNRLSGKLNLQLALAFAFGVVFVVVLLVLALAVPSPTDWQLLVFRVVLSLAAAGVAAMIPGFLNVSLSAPKRLAVSAAGALAVFLVVYLLNPAGIAQSDSRPKVYLMDSTLMVFSAEKPLPGTTNADYLIEILDDLPVTLLKEVIYPGWAREETIRREKPDLIIIHASAFYDRTLAEDPEERLAALLCYMQKEQTKFLIYSRSDYFSDAAQARATYVAKYPFLQGRVEVIRVKRYWDDVDTRRDLKDLVRSMLSLEK